MITDLHQRWRDRRDTYRVAREPLDPSRFEVGAIADDTTAKRFVSQHHYSGSYPAARVRMGLFRRGALQGVAIFSVPAQPKALACLPGDACENLELGRFVLLDEVEANAESWFLARCFEHLRRESFAGVVSFSDPVARTASDGGIVFGGHVGTIYQATNACYLGRSKPETRRLLPDGTVLHGRAIAKIRRRDQGWRYASQILVRAGADDLDVVEDPVAWLERWIPRLTRPLRHAGNHKYAWTLRRRDRRHLPASLPYPKLTR